MMESPSPGETVGTGDVWSHSAEVNLRGDCGLVQQVGQTAAVFFGAFGAGWAASRRPASTAAPTAAIHARTRAALRIVSLPRSGCEGGILLRQIPNVATTGA